MSRIAEVTVYDFDELSDKAKERAREWFREGIEDWWGSVYDDASKCADILGINIASKAVPLVGGGTRYDPAIYFGDMYCQGQGACFEGSYSYKKGCARAIRRHAPADYTDRNGKQHSKGNAKLAAIADGLVELQKRHGYKLTATVRHTGRYCNEYSTEIDVEYDGDTYSEHVISAEDAKALTDLLRDFMRWIFQCLMDEYEYQTSDETVDENIRANEYEFTEDGRRSRF